MINVVERWFSDSWEGALDWEGTSDDQKWYELCLAGGARIRIDRDETSKKVTVKIFTLPAFEELLYDFSASDKAHLKLIHRSSSFAFLYRWNPTHLIAATNALQKVGQARAVELLLAYVKLEVAMFKGTFPGRGEFSGRALPFAVVLFGATTRFQSPALGRTRRQLERSVGPICMVDDIPFLTHLGYMSMRPSTEPGFPSFRIHLDRIQKMGKFRETPLSPSGDPFKAVKQVEALHRKAHVKNKKSWGPAEEVLTSSFRWQSLRCIDAKWPQPHSRFGFAKWGVDDRFSAFEDWYAKKGLKWDKAKNRFVSPNLKKD